MQSFCRSISEFVISQVVTPPRKTTFTSLKKKTFPLVLVSIPKKRHLHPRSKKGVYIPEAKRRRICHITRGFATRDMTNSLVLLQKLCKNCLHPENPFSNSKTISQIKFPYKIEKLINSQQEWLGGKTLCIWLMVLLFENGFSGWG